MRLNSYGDIIAGVGGHDFSTVSVWRHDATGPEPLTPGSASGWMFDSEALCAGPDLFTLTAPEFQRTFFSGYMPNDSYAGGGKWIASRATENTLQGTVPPGYEAWKAHDVGPDGTVVLVLNGEYAVIWPTGDIDTISGVRDLRACAAGVILTDFNGLLGIKRGPDSGVFQPAQLDVMKYWAVSVGPSWLLYLADGYGLVLHHVANDDDGYQWNVAPYSPCGVTLADGRTVIAWSYNAGEQAGDLQRTFLTLGAGMSPLRPIIVPPDSPEPPLMPLTPKDRTRYENRLAHAVHVHTGMPETGPGGAWQGIHETGDRYQRSQPLDWSGMALAEGAFCRSGSDAIKVPQGQLDPLFDECKAIDTVELQRR